MIVDRNKLTGSVDLVNADGRDLTSDEAAALLARRIVHPQLAPDKNLSDDTRLWAALQSVGGGTWGGCVYDCDRIIELLNRR